MACFDLVTGSQQQLLEIFLAYTFLSANSSVNQGSNVSRLITIGICTYAVCWSWTVQVGSWFETQG